MDTIERHEADVERLARTLGEDAERVRRWVAVAASRRRIGALHDQACTQRAAVARDRTSWQDAREQAEIDREARSSARRMADGRPLVATSDQRAPWLP